MELGPTTQYFNPFPDTSPDGLAVASAASLPMMLRYLPPALSVIHKQ